MKVYVLTNEYKNGYGGTDTEVSGVFTTLEQAQRVAEASSPTWSRPSEWRQLSDDRWDSDGEWSIWVQELTEATDVNP